MEEILAMQKKNSPNSPTKLKELLAQISKTHYENDKIVQKLEENEIRISELSKEVSTLREEYKGEKKILENNIHESEEHKHLLESLKKDKEKLVGSVRELEARYQTLKKTKPSLKDLQLLESGKRKYKLYKEFTGIRWDYSAPENTVEGYITNKKDYLHKISYKGEMDFKTLRELLWKEIDRSTMDSTTREESKENKPINK